MAGPNDDLATAYGFDPSLFGDGEDEDAPKPPTTSQKGNIYQDYVQILTDLYPGLDPAFASNFLAQNPELVSQLYANFDVASAEGIEKFSKLLLELERSGSLGSNLGQKAGTLSRSVTTRTLSPSEAEAIFNLELKWQQALKQAPLEAAKFLGKNYVPEAWRGMHMPGFEEGGVYRKNLPGIDPKMFEYTPTGNVGSLAELFRPEENSAMAIARQAMMNALTSGISSTSTTSSSSTPMGGPAAPTASPGALLQAFYAMNPSARFSAPVAPIPEPPPMAAPTPAGPPQLIPQGTNPFSRAWSSLFGNWR